MEFQKANVKDLGGGDLEDEVYATKFLVATGYVDEKKIGITGGSYGGDMKPVGIGKKTGGLGAAGGEIGIINWLAMLGDAEPVFQGDEKKLLGEPGEGRGKY